MKSVHFNEAEVEMLPYPVEAERVTPGTEIVFAPIWQREDGSEIRGFWQMSPGTLEDVRSDEMFVVLSGRATVQFPDGRTWELGPGEVGVLTADDPCRWITHETLSKAFTIRM